MMLTSQRNRPSSGRAALCPGLCAALSLVLALGLGAASENTVAQAGISMGNGSANWIITEGATRDGATFVFPEVNIAGDGWLVMHPFKDGRPDGNTVAGFSPVSDGRSTAVSITVKPAPASGDRFVVMLHSDANGNGDFDFVFINEREVVDKAVFEGSTMIGHVYATP